MNYNIIDSHSFSVSKQLRKFCYIIEELGHKIVANVCEIGLKMVKAMKNSDNDDSNNNIPKLERGDLIAASDYVFIGQGLRTNECAIKLLLKNNVFGTKYAIVVKDEWRNQQEMHLDTYFNLLGENCCVLSQWRQNGLKNGKTYRTLIDMYEMQCQKQKYMKIIENKDFYQFLTNNLELNVVLVSEEHQSKYAINFLTIAKIVGVEGVSDEYMKQLSNIGVNTKWIDISDVTHAWIHCSTQPILQDHSVESSFWCQLEQVILNPNVIAMVVICFCILCASCYYYYFYFITEITQATM